MKFGRLTDLLINVEKLNQDTIFGKIILLTSVQRYIIYLNKTDQIFKDNIGADGVTIDGTYGDYTINQEGKGRVPYSEDDLILDESGNIGVAGSITQQASVGDVYFLKNTEGSGSFFESFKVVTDSGGFVIEATTKKNDIDLLEYGKLLGLTNENKAEFSQAIKPLVVEATRQAFFGKGLSTLFT